MDFDAYRAANFVDPEPEPRFAFVGTGGPTLYFSEYDSAVGFYTEVLGDPAYVEGSGTRSWRIGSVWLTLLKGGDGAPRNTEISVLVETSEEVQRLWEAFIAAGATGTEPSDQLMHRPVRIAFATDPFGTELMVFAPLT
jgi:hypothetical protein